MTFQWEIPNGIISTAAMVINWGIILFFVFRYYRRLVQKPAIWRVLLVTVIGLMAFTFNVMMFGTSVKIALLPLGVWIVYIVIRNRSWGTYRTFAWIGFWANYLFLVTALISGFLHNAMYPKADVNTYVADVSHAALVSIHPSASAAVLHKEELVPWLHTVSPEQISGMDWYYEAKYDEQLMLTNQPKERFPYALTGIKSKWGSGLASSIYVEHDGQGLLIATDTKHYYYRSEQPLIEVEGNQP